MLMPVFLALLDTGANKLRAALAQFKFQTAEQAIPVARYPA